MIAAVGAAPRASVVRVDRTADHRILAKLPERWQITAISVAPSGAIVVVADHRGVAPVVAIELLGARRPLRVAGPGSTLVFAIGPTGKPLWGRRFAAAFGRVEVTALRAAAGSTLIAGTFGVAICSAPARLDGAAGRDAFALEHLRASCGGDTCRARAGYRGAQDRSTQSTIGRSHRRGGQPSHSRRLHVARAAHACEARRSDEATRMDRCDRDRLRHRRTR